MSDITVAAALRSNARLVVIEAPAGCGKTHQAADYAHWLAIAPEVRQVLILTHTHAACDVFRSRTVSVRRQIQITTIDGLVAQIAGTYHLALGIPADITDWVRQQGQSGFEQLAVKVSDLLSWSPVIRSALISRYPIIICDEHQDASAAQHRVLMQLFEAGAKLRVFGDPMQAIYVKGKAAREAHTKQREELCGRADINDKLDYPHRWTTGSIELGQWVLDAREALKSGHSVDLRGRLPRGLNVISADNISPHPMGFRLEPGHGREVSATIRNAESMMVLAGQNDTVRAIGAYLGRRVPIWEGHTRDALSAMVSSCVEHAGSPVAMAHVFKRFVQETCKGFSDTTFAKRFISEVESDCLKPCRLKPERLQTIGRCILEAPNHLGLARALALLKSYITEEASFADVKIDFQREFHDAIRLASFEDPQKGLLEMARWRSASPAVMPTKVISTVHKAKGLESEHVVLLPCDRAQFGVSDEKRCLLYVALSRARSSLTLVVSPQKPSPWLVGPEL